MKIKIFNLINSSELEKIKNKNNNTQNNQINIISKSSIKNHFNKFFSSKKRKKN